MWQGIGKKCEGGIRIKKEITGRYDNWSGETITQTAETHCVPVMPNCNIGQAQHWFRQWLVAWWHQTITGTNTDFSLGSVAFTWEQCHIEYPNYILYKEFQNNTHQNYCHVLTATGSVWNSVKKVVGPHALKLKS